MIAAPKFLPGPWHIGQSRNGANANFIYKHGEIPELDTGVCHVTGLPINRKLSEIDAEQYEERLATARLIAAAPELFEALEVIANAASVGGLSAGERKGLAMAAKIAAAALAKVSP